MNGKVFINGGFWLCLIGGVMAAFQTYLHGNHDIPQSTSEAICDLICCLIVLTGFVLVTIGRAMKP